MSLVLRRRGIIATKVTSGSLPQPLGAWSFDDTPEDSSGNGLTATVTAYTTGHTNDGAVGDASHAAASYSGALIASPTAVSFMFWFYPTRTSAGGLDGNLTFLSIDSTGTPGYLVVAWSNSTHLLVQFTNAAGTDYSAVASVTTAQNTWVHVAVTWVSGTLLLYLDGVQVGTATTSGVLPTLSWLEAGGLAAASAFNLGVVDDLRVFDTALTATDINTYMNTPVPAPTPTASPILAWSFDDTGEDSSGNGHTATVNAYTTGHTNDGAQGDGSHPAAIYTGALLTAPTQLTVMSWVNPTSHSGTPDILTLDDSSDTDFFGFYWTDGTHIKGYISDSSGEQETAPLDLSSGTWTHLAVVVTPTGAVFYINGTSVATMTRSGTINDQTLLVLGGNDGTFAPGVYDDTRLFDVALSSDDINTYMNTPVPPPAIFPAPVAAYNFNEGTGLSSADSSGLGQTLSLHNVSPSPWGTGHTSFGLSGVGATSDGPTANTTLTHTFTVDAAMMFWVNASTIRANYDGLFANQGNFDAYLDPSGLVGYDLWPEGESTYTLPTGTWVHLCFQYNGLWVNGVKVFSSTNPSGWTGTWGGLQLLGSFDTTSTQVVIDDFRVIDAHLTDAEIVSAMNTPA